jgi:hypothetical protein
MDKRLFWRAALVQAAAVAVVAGILIALPLDGDFFKDNGIWAGPIAWALCAIVTAFILKLDWQLALFAAAAGGVAAGLVTAAGADHWIGVLVAIGVFAACCGGYETAQRELAAADADRERDQAAAERERDGSPTA